MRLCDLDEIKICVDRQYENCHGYSGSKKAIYREAILAVKSILHSAKSIDGVTVQEWVSVKDRLPENGVHVLLCCEMRRYGGEIAGKYVCDGYYAEANKIIAGGFPDECDCEYSEEDDEYYLCEGWYEVIKNWDDYNSVAVEDFVTHWLPLPQPPKREKTEE